MRLSSGRGAAIAALTMACGVALAGASPWSETAAGPVGPTAAAGAPRTADPGWPRIYTSPSGARLQIYQPQIASWEGLRRLVAFGAVAYQPETAAKIVLGTVKVEADTNVALEERVVRLERLTIAEAHFGSAGRDLTRTIVSEVERAMPEFERAISLDRLLAGLDRSQIRATNVEGVRADPPRMFFSRSPAILVTFDGPPIWSPSFDACPSMTTGGT